MAKTSKLSIETKNGDTSYTKTFDKLDLSDYEDSDILEFCRDKYLPILESGTTLSKIAVTDYDVHEVEIA